MDLLAEDDPEYFDKKEFLESVIISLEGSIAYANRLAELAEEKQREAGVTEERKAELERAAAALRKVPSAYLSDCVQTNHFFSPAVLYPVLLQTVLFRLLYPASGPESYRRLFSS